MTDTASSAPVAVDDPPTLTAEEIAAELRQAIVDGRVPVGSPLSQVRLGDDFGVSRTTVREALRLLQERGLLVAEFNRRMRVAALDPDDIDQTYAMLISLEAQAVRLAVPRLTDSDLDEAQLALDQIERLGPLPPIDDWHEPHRRFHAILQAPAGRRFADMVDRLTDQAACVDSVEKVLTAQVFVTSTAQHAGLISACRARDAHTAALLMARHHAWAARTILSLVAPGHEPAATADALSAAELTRR